jgi:hypothetical protein
MIIRPLTQTAPRQSPVAIIAQPAAFGNQRLRRCPVRPVPDVIRVGEIRQNDPPQFENIDVALFLVQHLAIGRESSTVKGTPAYHCGSNAACIA